MGVAGDWEWHENKIKYILLFIFVVTSIYYGAMAIESLVGCSEI